MKRSFVFTFLAVATLTAFTSCSKDDTNIDNVENQETTLVGTWFLASVTLDGEEEPLNECNLQSNMILASDGTITDNDYVLDGEVCINDGLSGTYEISDETITFEFVEGNESIVDSYSFSISENTLSLTDPFDGAILTYTSQ